jgi:hypothetical protein
MYRVLRSGGRAVVTMGENTKAVLEDAGVSGTADAFGQWRWSDADAGRIAEEAGFAEVAVSVMGVWKFKLVKCLKPTLSAAMEAHGMTADASATGGAAEAALT